MNPEIEDYTHFISNLNEVNEDTTVTTFLNPFSYYKVINNQALEVGIDHYYADGALLVFFHNILRKSPKPVDRVSFDFSSVAGDVLAFADTNNKSVFFIGATSDELDAALFNLRTVYPSCNISGVHGFMSPEQIISSIPDSDIFIVGMGTPIQEEIAIQLKKKFPIGKKIYTCGGFVSQTAIKCDYYHPLVKKLGLRWLQRFVMHSHVRRRIAVDYPRFVIKYLLDR
ncbi:WecB/TagA/CpsF family glycosyltransferase [Vibrio vulnificus]|nr:WecB/TagA/CpsF family glycosyltransferase [Vibrio vulnificus]